VGYVGTPYRGNQSNPTLPRGETVDDVLEDALFQAGHVVATNYASRGLGRLSWSRSSRTDKGVSSLATVVSCRLEVDGAWWEADADGGALCERVNAQLPPSVRLFAATQVPRRFEARHACSSRTYHYLLPLRVLTLAAPSRDTPITAPLPPPCDEHAPMAMQRVSALADALRRFEGTHPFHCFTKMKNYAPPPSKARKAPVAEEEEEEEGDAEEDAPMAEQPSSAPAPPDILGSYERGTFWCCSPREADRVGNAHFRRVMSASVSQPLRIEGSEPFVRITFVGESFMVYQIRKMIATAVAVARGGLDPEFIDAALTRPCRARSPIAPASTLVLAEASFWPFKPDTSGRRGAAAEEERRLETSLATQQEVAAWHRAVLLPSLLPSLASEGWEEFLSNLDAMVPEAQDVQAVVQAARIYSAERQARPPREFR